jgi:hypothetical protein
VFTTVVEQLAGLTGISVETLDPDHHRGSD